MSLFESVSMCVRVGVSEWMRGVRMCIVAECDSVCVSQCVCLDVYVSVSVCIKCVSMLVYE